MAPKSKFNVSTTAILDVGEIVEELGLGLTTAGLPWKPPVYRSGNTGAGDGVC
jgi:hypothetical protein